MTFVFRLSCDLFLISFLLILNYGNGHKNQRAAITNQTLIPDEDEGD